jgi:chromosome segregation ATPase
MEKTREQKLQAAEGVAERYQQLKLHAKHVFESLKVLDTERKSLVQQYNNFLSTGQEEKAKNLLDSIGTNRYQYDRLALDIQDLHQQADACLEIVAAAHVQLCLQSDAEIVRLEWGLGDVIAEIEQVGYLQEYIAHLAGAGKQVRRLR